MLNFNKMVTSAGWSHPVIPKEHLHKARKNENLGRALFNLEGPHCDWIITIFFYAVMHYFYSTLPIKYIQSNHFGLINEITKKYGKNSDILKLFLSLKDKSEDMRYYPQLAKKYENDRKFCKEICEEKLEKIKQKLGCK